MSYLPQDSDRRGGLHQVSRDQEPGFPVTSGDPGSLALHPDPHPRGPGYLRAAPETADCLLGPPKR